MSSFMDRSSKQWHLRKIDDESCDCSSTSSGLEMNDVGTEMSAVPATQKVVIQAPPPERARNGIGKRNRLRKPKKHRVKRVLSTKYMPKKPRLVGKHGGLKIAAAHVPQKHGMYFSDLFTTMIDSKWRWITLLYCTMYCGSWLIFGLLWYLITYYRGDNYCVDNVYSESFASAFLFSLETQTTIGYGGRQITPNCPEAVILLNIQSLVGFLIGALELGLIFAKLSRPRNRAETILFSRNAVVALRDGKMCLMFRVGDVRKSQILEPNFRVQIFRKRITREGIELPFYQQDLAIGIDWTNQEKEEKQCYNLFLILPLTIVHVIDEESPLFDIHPRKLADCDFEMVAILEGTVEATGMQTQAKTSYLGDEILWGHEFVNTINENQWKGGRYRVDFSVFDDTVPVNTPRMSAKEYYEGKGHLAHAFSVESEPEDFDQNFDGGNVTEDSEEEEGQLEPLTKEHHCTIDICLTDDESPVCYV